MIRNWRDTEEAERIVEAPKAKMLILSIFADKLVRVKCLAADSILRGCPARNTITALFRRGNVQI